MWRYYDYYGKLKSEGNYFLKKICRYYRESGKLIRKTILMEKRGSVDNDNMENKFLKNVGMKKGNEIECE